MTIRTPGIFSGLGRTHAIVLLISYLGWVFDIMDMFLLVLVKDTAMKELVGANATGPSAKDCAAWAVSLTLIGWSLGGLIFGVITDKWGRTKTMALTIVIYSLFTGLCGCAQTWQQFLIFRFIAALGIGGEWAAGASIIAEAFPKTSRAWGAGILQSASGAGFFAAILLERAVSGNWRHAFYAGAIPAVLALVVRLGMNEPEAWVAAHKTDDNKSGPLRELFSNPILLRRIIAATGLAFFGIAAYWCTNFEATNSLVNLLKSQKLDPASSEFKNMRTLGLSVMTLGNIVGFLTYIPITEKVGRKWAFAVFHLGSLISMPVAFLFSSDYMTWLCLFFVAGAFTSGIYSGYTITFPELFPTRVRATGAGFCYNVSRVIAAPGPAIMVALQGVLITSYALTEARSVALAGAIMAGLYFFAALFIPLLPETRGISLDE
ncbi:MAG: MFS transporter [Planctomycetota bacterium]